MSAATVVVALPAAAVAILLVLRSPLARRLKADPRGDRWHERTTPLGGGIGIFAGLLAGVGVTLAAGGVHGHEELYGILGGCALLFAAGLIDDLWSVPPGVK